jgi:hypothetical protein
VVGYLEDAGAVAEEGFEDCEVGLAGRSVSVLWVCRCGWDWMVGEGHGGGTHSAVGLAPFLERVRLVLAFVRWGC